ncbi:MAG: Sapep family Mn(2+)-dependent dipeptidase [Ruthenibacterium lactatiformans]
MDEKLLLEQIDAFVAENRENVLRDLKTLVDINSVEGQPQPGAPFGPGPKKALEAALDIAAGMGLDAHNCEGYIGYADLPGASPTQIATITHLDVVPEGNGWTGSPFDMVRRDGYVVGRGVADDKGPAVLTLYAAKFFKQQGATLPYTLRILLGANEETGMKDVDYYLEHYPQPAFCFTPDAEFPVCYGEKGGYGGWLVSAPLHGNLIDFQGGVAHNVVPDRAYALVRATPPLKDTENVKVTAEADGVARISAFGKGGHAACRHGNAIALVVDYQPDNRLCSGGSPRWKCCAGCASTDGSSVGIAAQDDVFDPLTCAGGVIAGNGALRQSIDIRFPTSTNAGRCAALSKLAQDAGGSFRRTARVPFYIDPNLSSRRSSGRTTM